jgi:hypothetical protein
MKTAAMLPENTAKRQGFPGDLKHRAAPAPLSREGGENPDKIFTKRGLQNKSDMFFCPP